MIGKAKDVLIAFRKKIHSIIPAYRDATMDAIDALSTNQNASSVIELSENKYFRRKCSSIGKVIRYFLVSDKEVEDGGTSDSKEAEDGNTPNAIDAEQVKPEFSPDKTLQKSIEKEIASLCSPPEKRNFFYLPVTSRLPLDPMPKH